MAESKQTFSNVLSINPYNKSYYKGNSTRIAESKAATFEKDQFAISYLNTNSFITSVIEISKNIPDEDIGDVIESKTYEDLALDMAIEYSINYVESFTNSDENNRYFHVFVVDPLNLEDEFKDTVQKIKYIDQIVPVPLLLKSLYTKEIIEDNGVHCFIYFQENDAFFTLYNEEKFVYTKSLKYSFVAMHERFCELLGEQIELNIFVQILAQEGLSTVNAEYQKYLIKLFGEVFLHINDVITYAKRAFEFEKFDHVYIGSQVGKIDGLDEYTQTYLGLASSSFDFDYGFENESFYVDQIHSLMHLYTQVESENKYECNFSIFHRPPPFIERASGKLIMTTAAALLVAFIYPGVYWGLTYAEELHHALLTSEYKEVHNDRVTREATINLKLANQKKFQTLLDSENTIYNDKKSTLVKIHDVKVNYPMKAKIIGNFTKDFNAYGVQLRGLEYEQVDSKNFYFNLSSKRPNAITSLVEYLTKKKSSKYNFSLEYISFDEDIKRYGGILKVVIK